MAVQGIIAEYNPFHDGHGYHIKESARQNGSNATIVVMSGSFVQRGEPAMFSKTARTEMALHHGVDLVLELPFAFSCASAEFFASGAVSTLIATGVVDYLCFGTESGSINDLQILANILANEPPSFKEDLKKSLNAGLSFATSREIAMTNWLDHNDKCQIELSKLLSSPNNILAVEYLKAMKHQLAGITPFTIQRLGHGYNDTNSDGIYPSATAIRKFIVDEVASKRINTKKIPGVPEFVQSIIEKEILEGRGPVTAESFFPMIQQRLRTADPMILTKLPWMENGLENRIISAAHDGNTFQDLVCAMTSKRYPITRIQRILMAELIGYYRHLQLEISENGYAQYIRVLGYSTNGKKLLAQMRKTASLPIIGKSSQWGKNKNPLIKKMLALEARASDTWNLACREQVDKKGGSEYRFHPISYQKNSIKENV